jgi:hypothetical protein
MRFDEVFLRTNNDTNVGWTTSSFRQNFFVADDRTCMDMPTCSQLGLECIDWETMRGNTSLIAFPQLQHLKWQAAYFDVDWLPWVTTEITQSVFAFHFVQTIRMFHVFLNLFARQYQSSSR